MDSIRVLLVDRGASKLRTLTEVVTELFLCSGELGLNIRVLGVSEEKSGVGCLR